MPYCQLPRSVARPQVGKGEMRAGAEQPRYRGRGAAVHHYRRQFEGNLQAIRLVVALDVAAVHVLPLAPGLLAKYGNLEKQISFNI